MTRFFISLTISLVIVSVGMRVVPGPTKQATKKPDLDQIKTMSVPAVPPASSTGGAKPAEVAKTERVAGPRGATAQSTLKDSLKDSRPPSDRNTEPKTPEPVAPGSTTGGGRQVVIDQAAAARIETWLQRGQCRLTLIPDLTPGSENGTTGSSELARHADAVSGEAGTDIGIRLELSSPLGIRLRNVADPAGASRSSAVVLWLPGSHIADSYQVAGVLRLTCDSVGEPKFVVSTAASQ